MFFHYSPHYTILLIKSLFSLPIYPDIFHSLLYDTIKFKFTVTINIISIYMNYYSTLSLLPLYYKQHYASSNLYDSFTNNINPLPVHYFTVYSILPYLSKINIHVRNDLTPPAFYCGYIHTLSIAILPEQYYRKSVHAILSLNIQHFLFHTNNIS